MQHRENEIKAERLGREMKAYREKHGMWQSDLAKLLNISQTAVSYYERGLRYPRKKAFWRMVETGVVWRDGYSGRYSVGSIVLVKQEDKTCKQGTVVAKLADKNNNFFYAVLPTDEDECVVVSSEAITYCVKSVRDSQPAPQLKDIYLHAKDFDFSRGVSNYICVEDIRTADCPAWVNL